MKIYTLAESADEMFRLLHTFDDNPPDLIQTGITALDKRIGGFFPGSCGVLGLAQGVGKSSLILVSAMKSKHMVGIVSLEDTCDVLGSRSLASVCGIDSLAMRRNELSRAEKTRLQAARARLAGEDGVRVAYAIGGGPKDIGEAVDALCKAGCRLIWLDYLQKARESGDDRRNSVSRTYTMFQAQCAKGGAAGMVASQFSRQDPTKRPRSYWLKESGDIENEARVIILGWREPGDPARLNLVLEKSTFGGEGFTFSYERDESGTLREVTEDRDLFLENRTVPRKDCY